MRRAMTIALCSVSLPWVVACAGILGIEDVEGSPGADAGPGDSRDPDADASPGVDVSRPADVSAPEGAPVLGDEGLGDAADVDGGDRDAPSIPLPLGAPLAITSQDDAKRLDIIYGDPAGAVDVVDRPGAGNWTKPTPIGAAASGAQIATAHLADGAGHDVLYAAYIADDGTVKASTAVDSAPWSQPQTIAQGPIDSTTTDVSLGVPGQAVAAAIEGDNQVDVFYADKWGSLNVAWSTPTGWSAAWGWRFPLPADWPAGQTFLGPATVIATGMLGSQLNVFATATNGATYVWWLLPDGWAGPLQLTSAGFAPPDAPLATGNRNGTGELDVFVARADGIAVIYVGSGSWCDSTSAPPCDEAPMLAGSINEGSHLATIREGSNQLDVLAVDHSGALSVRWITDELATWRSWPPTSVAEISSQGAAPSGIPVGAGTQGTDAQAFFVGADGRIHVMAELPGGWSEVPGP